MKETRARKLFQMAKDLGWKHSHTSGSHQIWAKEGRRDVSIPGPENRIIGAGLAGKIAKQLKGEM